MAELTDIRETVREKYAAAAKGAGSAAAPSCCGPGGVTCTPADDAGRFGGALYDEDAREDLPRAALDASLGCGVPTAVADLHDGETVLDLGSGAGADVLISARRVGPAGKVIGVDMTDEMLELARRGAADAGAENVEFIKGYLEALPLPDASVDVVISNCVINLSGDKTRVIGEAARVLRAGGRLAVSDVIADPGMDDATRADMAAWTGCVAGALTEAEFRAALHRAGFEGIEIRETHRVHEHAAAAIIRAGKPHEPSAADRRGDTLAIADCALDRSQLEAQQARYRELARHVASVGRLAGEVLVRFAEDPPPGLLEQTLEVERRCCPFFHMAYEAGERQLSIKVESTDQDPALDALFDAFS